MLLSLVNDVLDLKLIKQGIYEQKLDSFNPKETFEFIVAMFAPICQAQKT